MIESKESTTDGNNVRVVVRIRPLNDNELLDQIQPVIYPKPLPRPLPAQQQQQEANVFSNKPLSPIKTRTDSTSFCDDEMSIISSTSSTTSSCRRRSIFHRFRNKGRRNTNKNEMEEKPTTIVTTKRTENSFKSYTSTATTTTFASTNDDENNAASTSSLHTTAYENNNTATNTSAEAIYHPTICMTSNNRQYELDSVFGPETNQTEFYQQCIGNNKFISHLFDSSLNSKNHTAMNLTILAYGMTGTGKSYTMNMTDGVIYHAVQDLFRTRHESENDEKNISIRMSCFEIYSDEIRDLLDYDDDNNDKTKLDRSPMKKSTTALKLREQGGEHNVTILGLKEILVETTNQVYELLDHAQTRRMTCTTQLNEQSSRSHAIYMFHVLQQSNASNKNSTMTTTKLTLVDLAGSERVKESGVMGIHQKESIHINQDLFVLGKVISSLHEKKVHVPYRDSKLTRILRNSLGGCNCHTILIACVSPAQAHLDESLHTLRYAERARSISNSTSKNNINGDNTAGASLTPAQIIMLQEENAILRARLANMSRRQAMYTNNNCNVEFQHYPTIGGIGERGGIKLSNIANKLQRAKQETNSIRQYTTISTTHHDKKYRVLTSSQNNNDTHQQQEELAKLCESLRQEVDFVNSENDILRLQTIRLQDEIKRLRIMKGISNEPITAKDSAEDDEIDLIESSVIMPSHHDQVRLHAEKMLDWANRAIEKNRDSSSTSSKTSSNGTHLCPLQQTDESCAIFRARNIAENNENEYLISNMKNNVAISTSGKCPCQESVFSKQPEIVDFYLPKLGLFCSCGRKEAVSLVGSDPCLIENILRDWQVRFCVSCDVYTAGDLLRSYNKSPTELAKMLRTWRKENGMLSVKTKSCGIALRIWARTCRTVIKAMQAQNHSGKKLRPDFLDVSLDSDSCSVSTLGFCSSDVDESNLKAMSVRVPQLLN